MKAYIITTGVIFGLITVAHILRMVKEPHVFTEPVFLLLTVVAAALCVWSWLALRRMKQ